MVSLPKMVTAAFILLAGILIGINFALVRSNRVITEQYQTCEAALHLNPGDKLPALSGVDVMGSHHVVSYRAGNAKTLLLVFEQRCEACVVNWPYWQAILKRVDAQHVRVVGVDLQEGGLSIQYLARVGFPSTREFVLPDIQSILAYRFRYTPQTILIDADGTVEKVWSGALDPAETKEIEQRSLSTEATSLLPIKERATAPSP
jgi:hypothetical protein